MHPTRCFPAPLVWYSNSRQRVVTLDELPVLMGRIYTVEASAVSAGGRPGLRAVREPILVHVVETGLVP